MGTSPTTLAPADVQELTQIVQAAVAKRTPLRVVGGDSKGGMGHPQREATRVSIAKFDRIIDYDPAELVLTTGAGVKLSAILALLAEHGQMLAFEPYDFATTVGGTMGESTIGGVVAAGFAGSRRVSAGNVRDHVLGFTAVSGRGESFVAGGRVVKNVTGYDLSKLMCGSWGQLAIMTELTLKVLPRPRVSLTLAAFDLAVDAAYIHMTRALRSQSDVAAAAYVPSDVLEQRPVTLLRLEGFGPSVEARAQQLASLFDTSLEPLEAARADQWWARVCCADPLRATGEAVLWRICVPATQGAALCAELRKLDVDVCVDWGGALIWARPAASLAATTVRALAEQAGGHATLIHAPVDYRSLTPALHPESAGVAALTARVKASFDPERILDPHRFAST
jgi:glycolate oxidase FAD binding subunit